MTPGLENVLHSLRLRPILEQPDSPLLCLPGELRNRIYNYVLTVGVWSIRYQEGPVYSALAQPSLRRSYFAEYFSDEDEDFNQLKFVCRQLYTETALLELRLNRITFCGEFDTKETFLRPARLFTEFLEECAPTKASWLSRVELELGGDQILPFNSYVVPLESSVTLELVADFCHMYPQCRVKYITRTFNTESEAYSFMTQGYFITLAVRHKDLLCLAPGAYPFDFEAAVEWATSRCVKRLDVPNFRIFPQEGSRADGYFLGELITAPGMTDAEREATFKLAKDWIKNGI
jgi:hypothetical protein